MLAEKFDIFKGVSAFAQLDDGERYPLALKEATDNYLLFAEETYGIKFKAIIDEFEGCKFLRYESTFVPQNLGETRGRNHYDYECTVGLNVKEIADIKNFVATYNKSEFWVYPFFGKLRELPAFTQTILCERENDYQFFTTVCDKEFVSTIKGSTDGFDIYVWNNCLPNDIDTIALVWGEGNDAYSLPYEVNKKTFTILGKEPVMRTDKKYPDVFEYLGWCSWDAFHMDVTHDALIQKAQELKS